MYPKRSFQPQPVPARFAWIATLVVGLCQFPLSSPLRESISQAWIDKLSGHPTETRTPISTLKGWPPSQLEDGTLCDFSVSPFGRIARFRFKVRSVIRTCVDFLH